MFNAKKASLPTHGDPVRHWNHPPVHQTCAIRHQTQGSHVYHTTCWFYNSNGYNIKVFFFALTWKWTFREEKWLVYVYWGLLKKNKKTCICPKTIHHNFSYMCHDFQMMLTNEWSQYFVVELIELTSKHQSKEYSIFFKNMHVSMPNYNERLD